MALHLVGETIDKTRGHRQAGAGELVQLMRGIYIDAGDDISGMPSASPNTSTPRLTCRGRVPSSSGRPRTGACF